MTTVTEKQPRPTRSAITRLMDRAWLLLAFSSLCWSGNHILGRAIEGQVPPAGFSAVRWLIPAIVLWPLVRPHMARDWPAIKARLGVMLWLGITGGALFSALQYVGLQHTTALNVSVLNSLVPVLIVAAGAVLFRDHVGVGQVAGIATSLAGVLVIVTRADLDTLRQLAFSWGDLIIILNMAVFSIYAACLLLQPSIHWLSFMFMLAVISAVSTLPFAVWESLSGFTFQPTLLTLLAVVYVSTFPSLFAFAAWNRGVELLGANRAGPFLHLVPIYTAILGYAFLGDPLAAYHVAGLVLILTGVWLATRSRSVVGQAE